MKDMSKDLHLFEQITVTILWYEITWGEKVTSPVKPKVILFCIKQSFKSFDHQLPLVTGTAFSQKPYNLLALCIASWKYQTLSECNIFTIAF